MLKIRLGVNVAVTDDMPTLTWHEAGRQEFSQVRLGLGAAHLVA